MRQLWMVVILAWWLPAQAQWFVPPKVDLVVVEKSRHSLSLYYRGRFIKRYWVALGPNPAGHKLRAGDGRTPEGRYLLDYKKDHSRFYKAIHISYPNLQDLERAKTQGLDPGGEILLHGQPLNGAEQARLQGSNWTNGCIAVLDEDMDEIWAVVQPGMPIEIRP